jgi:hypothetical protein
MPSYDEERHLMKVVLTWAAITFVLLGLAIGVLALGLEGMVRALMP